MILAIVLILLMLFCSIAEFSRVWIIAQGVKEATQQAVISTVNDNYDDVYHAVREGYADFCASLSQAMDLTANRIEERPDEDTLADAAIHFALLSYATGLASSRYVAMLREQKEAAGEPSAKGKKKERE